MGAFVHSHLRKNDIQVVLSGGAVVAIYSRGEYVSRDLDLVNLFAANRKTIRKAMQDLGFREEGRYFRHPDSQFLIEFPPGPLTVGTEPVREISERKYSTGILRILSPTDCVKDRLAAFYHWGDNQCLIQAVMVTRAQAVDLMEIKRWSTAEGKAAEYELIKVRFIAE